MEFFKLEINNFMSFAKEEIEFKKDGLTLIEGVNHDEGGSNGSGKSTIFDAISWCLFGKTVRGLKDDAVMNRLYKKGCRVSLRLNSRGVDYVIERNRNNGELANRLYYMKRTKSIELGTVAMTQEQLLKDLGIDFELFRCTVLFAQEETFNFVNASNKEQKEILSKVMRIDFDEYLERAKTEMIRLEDEMEEIQSKLMVLKSHVDEEPEKAYEEEISEWDSEKEKEIKLHKDRIASYQEVIDSFDKPQDITRLTETASKIASKIDEYKKEWRRWCEIASDMRSEAAAEEKEIAKMRELEADEKCHVCLQLVKTAHVASICEDLTITRNKRKRDEAAAKVQAEEFDAKVIDYTAKLEKVKDLIRTEKAKAEKIEDALAGKKSHEDQIKIIKGRENQWLKKREEHVEKQKKIREKILSMGSDQERIERDLPYYKFWVNAFGDSGIKSFVFDLICSSLTNKTNKFLNILTSGNVLVSFDTQKKLKSGEFREKFDCVVMTNGERVPYESYSGGEKRKISLAVDMALSSIMSEYYGSKFSLVAFDEQTNYMDKQSRDNFMVMLKEVSKDRCVFVIDHDAEFKGLFDNTITVEKRGGVSRIV